MIIRHHLIKKKYCPKILSYCCQAMNSLSLTMSPHASDVIKSKMAMPMISLTFFLHLNGEEKINILMRILFALTGRVVNYFFNLLIYRTVKDFEEDL